MQGNAKVKFQPPTAALGEYSAAAINVGAPIAEVRTREVDIGDLLDLRQLGPRQFVTLALCLLVTLLDGFDNQAIALLVTPMSRDLHIPPSDFGLVFGTAAVGMILCALVIGPLADRFGRKRMLVWSTLCFGLGSFLTANVQTFPELIALRFLTGIGLGGVLPNVIAIAAEFSPRRLSRTCITIIVAGLPAGAMIGALVATALLRTHGWQATYVVGGVLPVIIALGIIVWMPESVRYLIARHAPHERVVRIVRLVAPEVSTQNVHFVSRGGAHAASPGDTRRFGLRDIFTEGRAKATIFLWIPYFMNLMVVYFSISWLPSVILASGQSLAISTAATAAFAVGGVLGSLSQGPMMNRLGAARMLMLQSAAAVFYAVLLGTATLSATMIVLATVVAGYALVGAQAGLNALAAETYPTAIRATGAGWALGAGRMGSIVGPVLGGVMIGRHWTAQQIFLVTAIPSLLAVAAIYVGRRR